MNRLEAKDIRLEGEGRLVAYTAVYGNVDHGGDRLMPGSLRNREQALRKGRLMIGHDYRGMGAAYIEDIQEDEYGVLTTYKFFTDEESQRIYQRCKELQDAGKAISMSIGWAPVEYDYAENGKVREIKGWDMLEGSIVYWGMNELAEAVQVKSRTFVDHAADTIEAVDDLVRRASDLQAKRLEDGRTLGAGARESLVKLAEDLREKTAAIDEILKTSEPDAQAAEGEASKELPDLTPALYALYGLHELQ